VNKRTIELGEDDIKAIKILLNEGYKKGIIPFEVKIEENLV